jgi:hypothetical protein
VARAGDCLHRPDRYHSYLHRTTGAYSRQLLQQEARGGPQGALVWLVTAIEGRRDDANIGLPLRIRLTPRHVHLFLNH